MLIQEQQRNLGKVIAKTWSDPAFNPFSGKIFTKPLFLEGMRNSWEICSRRNNSIAKYVELCSTLKQRT